MNCRFWLLTVLWSQLPSDICAQACPPEQFGDCNTSNDQYDNDTEVRPLCSLNCDFESDLCDYRQGCKDAGMTAWQAVNGSAQADQEGAECGRQSFSMLESRWVNFSTATETCLQFTVSRRLPYALDVFLKSYDNLNDTRIVMNRSLAGSFEGRFTYNFTLSHNLTVAKLLFRLYGGGGYSGTGERRLLLLHWVSIVEGSCGTRDCYASYRSPPCRGWDLVNWENHVQAGVDAFASVASGNNDQLATMTVPVSRPPLQGDKADCLNFRYKVHGLNSALNVSVRLLNGLTMTPWSLAGQDGEDRTSWLNATVPVNVTSAYLIIFGGRINLTSDNVSLTSVVIKANQSSCQLFPPDADTGYPAPPGWWSTWSACSPVTTTTEVDTQQTTTVSVTTSGLSPSSSPAAASSPRTNQPSTPISSSQPSVTKDSRHGGDSDETATIIGVTVAVLGVIVITVFVVIMGKWYSARRQQYSMHKEDMNGTTMHAVCQPVQSS